MAETPSRCVIAGGGPAGMVAGYLLARAGVPVTVLEKHADFLRDFRGDTIHPSTLTLMQELGLLEDFLTLPHQEIRFAEAMIGDRRLRLADFGHLPAARPFLALMPQWDFLNFMAHKAKAFAHFRLRMNCEAIGLRREGERVSGLRVRENGVEQDIDAELVIGADGRSSILRDKAGLPVTDLGAPIDVLWFRLPCTDESAHFVLGRIKNGRMLVMLYRGDYWQCALVIRKGGFDAIRQQGLECFRKDVAEIAGRNTSAIQSWDDIRLLTVSLNRLKRWHQPGLLFIGDAAHAMSPVGGVGINLAIQDAVAASNFLAGPLLRGTTRETDLAAVQRRRTFPTHATQRLQVMVHRHALDWVLASGKTPAPPWPLRLLNAVPPLQRLPARLIGLGFRPEHVRTRAA